MERSEANFHCIRMHRSDIEADVLSKQIGKVVVLLFSYQSGRGRQITKVCGFLMDCVLLNERVSVSKQGCVLCDGRARK